MAEILLIFTLGYFNWEESEADKNSTELQCVEACWPTAGRREFTWKKISCSEKRHVLCEASGETLTS